MLCDSVPRLTTSSLVPRLPLDWSASFTAADTPAPWPVHSKPVHSVMFLPNGHTVATGSDELLLWDPTAHIPRRLGQPRAGPGSTAGIVVACPDGRTLATGRDDNTVLLWDLTDPDAPAPWPAPHRAQRPRGVVRRCDVPWPPAPRPRTKVQLGICPTVLPPAASASPLTVATTTVTRRRSPQTGTPWPPAATTRRGCGCGT